MRTAGQLCLAAVLSGVPGAVALAHAPDAEPPDNWWRLWDPSPSAIAMLTAASGIYGLGVYRLWRESGAGRGIKKWRVTSFLAGMLVLGVALVSPIDPLATHLFSVHMVQHLLLLMVAPPLLVAGAPFVAVLWVLPRRVRQRFARWTGMRGPLRMVWYVLWQPLAVWGLYALTLWLWHLPRLYDLALENRLVHDMQHAAFLLTACLFWRVLIDPFDRLRANRGLGILLLFATSLHGGALGALLTLSPRPLYSSYAETTQPWNLTHLEDQQIAGAIMWMPAAFVYLALSVTLFILWLRELSRREAMHPAVSFEKKDLKTGSRRQGDER